MKKKVIEGKKRTNFKDSLPHASIMFFLLGDLAATL